MSKFAMVLLAGGSMLAGLLVLYLWPFSRPALMIPLIWWAMYLVSRARLSGPVLGLVDLAAEKAGFYPVPAKPVDAESPATAPAREDVDLEDETPAIA